MGCVRIGSAAIEELKKFEMTGNSDVCGIASRRDGCPRRQVIDISGVCVGPGWKERMHCSAPGS
jgi:hypothetical protein